MKDLLKLVMLVLSFATGVSALKARNVRIEAERRAIGYYERLDQERQVEYLKANKHERIGSVDKLVFGVVISTPTFGDGETVAFGKVRYVDNSRLLDEVPMGRGLAVGDKVQLIPYMVYRSDGQIRTNLLPVRK